MAKKKVVIETKEKNDTGGCLLDVILTILTLFFCNQIDTGRRIIFVNNVNNIIATA